MGFPAGEQRAAGCLFPEIIVRRFLTLGTATFFICDIPPPLLTRGFFAYEAVRGGCARVGPEARHLRLLQVGAETRVAGLAGQPAQAAVGER